MKKTLTRLGEERKLKV